MRRDITLVTGQGSPKISFRLLVSRWLRSSHLDALTDLLQSRQRRLRYQHFMTLHIIRTQPIPHICRLLLRLLRLCRQCLKARRLIDLFEEFMSTFEVGTFVELLFVVKVALIAISLIAIFIF
jgi:hypothetical protein